MPRRAPSRPRFVAGPGIIEGAWAVATRDTGRRPARPLDARGAPPHRRRTRSRQMRGGYPRRIRPVPWPCAPRTDRPPSMSPTTTRAPGSCPRRSRSSTPPSRRRALPARRIRSLPTRSAGCSTDRAIGAGALASYDAAVGCRRRLLPRPPRGDRDPEAAAQAAVPDDPRAPYYLGNLYYDRRRYRDAIARGNGRVGPRPVLPDRPPQPRHRRGERPSPSGRGTSLVPARVRRRLRPTPGSSMNSISCSSARTSSLGTQAGEARGASRPRRCPGRLGVEYATLLDQLDRSIEALAYLEGRRFHPWEGGEGVALGAYVTVRMRLGRAALAHGSVDAAVAHFEAALDAARIARRSAASAVTRARDPLRARASAGSGRRRRARARAMDDRGRTAPRPHGPGIGQLLSRSRAACARSRVGRAIRLQEPAAIGQAPGRATVEIDYFATSLPALLLFDDDLDLRNQIACRYLEGLASLGLGRPRAARRAFRDVLAGTSITRRRGSHSVGASSGAELGDRTEHQADGILRHQPGRRRHMRAPGCRRKGRAARSGRSRVRSWLVANGPSR